MSPYSFKNLIESKYSLDLANGFISEYKNFLFLFLSWLIRESKVSKVRLRSTLLI